MAPSAVLRATSPPQNFSAGSMPVLMKSYKSSYTLSTDFPSSPLLMSWTELKTRSWILYPTPAITNYITFFEKTWFFSTSYPISMWNISSAVEYDEPRTNNASEGGNNALNRAFNASHPSMWTFISTLRKFHAEVETEYQQISVCTATSEPVAKIWRVREARIKHVVEEDRIFVLNI